MTKWISHAFHAWYHKHRLKHRYRLQFFINNRSILSQTGETVQPLMHNLLSQLEDSELHSEGVIIDQLQHCVIFQCNKADLQPQR